MIVESKPKSVGEPLIEDWISDSEDENETESKSKQRKSSFAKVKFVKSNEHVKTPKESVKKVENDKQAKYPRKNSQSPRGNQRNWNNLMTQKLGSNFEFKNKACYVCGSFNHLIKDCDFYEKKMVEKPVWNNARRVNHQNSQRMTHPHPKRNFVPRAVLMKSGLKTLNTARQNSSRAAVSVNTARPINTAYPKPTVNYARPASNVFNRAHSHVRRPFNMFTSNKNSNFNEKVNTVKGNVTTAGPKVVVERPVRITGKGKISTGKLDFEDVYFVKELKFNLFSVSQMCDKKNSVLFTDTKCVVLSPDFKLLNENHVFLRVPRKDNIYSVNLKNIVPSGDGKDSKGSTYFGRLFLPTAAPGIRVKQKQLNLGVGTERMIFNIDSTMKHSYSNDDTCFSIDVINEILEEDFDALLNKGSKILYFIEGTLLEEESLY
ncbi:ribonuclease H-like domain-containing protein [Tanacetum coccineum]